MDVDAFLRNISDKDTIQEHLTFMALYIALYENFTSTFVDRVMGFLCTPCLEDGKIKYKETPVYREIIKNRIVDAKGNKDVLRATMLWLQEAGAMSQQDYSDFLSIKSIRNSYAHEMARIILEGVPPDDIQWFSRLLDLYGKVDKWWINQIEIPTSGACLPGSYEEDGVANLMLCAFSSVIKSLYLNEDMNQSG